MTRFGHVASGLLLEEFGHRQPLGVVAEAHEVDVRLRKLGEALDDPWPPLAVLVHQKAVLIGITMVLVFEGAQEAFEIAGEGEDGGPLSVCRDVEAVERHGCQPFGACPATVSGTGQGM